MKTREEVVQAAEKLALGQYLYGWPELPYDEILVAILARDEDVTVREHFENDKPDDVVEYIETLKVSVLEFYDYAQCAMPE